MPAILTPTPERAVTKSGHVLTRKQKKFCESYVLNIDNPEQRYIAVKESGYNISAEYNTDKWRHIARNITLENLTKPAIKEYIEEMLVTLYFNDNSVMQEHTKVLKQDEQLNPKCRAIDMFYRLKGSYAPEKRQNMNVNLMIAEDEKERLKELLE